jgi:hypothetical protein
VLRRFAFVGISTLALTAVLGGSLGIAAGCRHDREPPPPAIDAPKVDVNLDSVTTAPPVTVLVDGADRDARLSCSSVPRMEPAVIYPDAGGDESGIDASDPGDAAPGGTLVEKQIELIAFGTGGADKLFNQVVDVYYDNTFASGKPDVTTTSDDKGLFTILVPKNKRVGYHVHASPQLDDYFGLDDLHQPIPPATMIRWQGVTLDRRQTFALALTGDKNWLPVSGTGVIAGRVLDCDRRYMQYANVLLWDEDAGKLVDFAPKCGTGTEICRVYLTDSELPDVGRQYTSRSSLFTILNVPVGKRLTLQAYSNTTDGKQAVVASRKVEVKPGVITTQFLEPDAPKW